MFASRSIWQYDQVVAVMRPRIQREGLVGERVKQPWHNEGRAMSLEQAIAYVLEGRDPATSRPPDDDR